MILLIASRGENRGNNATVADGIPTITIAPAAPAAPPAPQATVTAPAVKAPPAAPAKSVQPVAVQPVARTAKCDPIVGSGSLNGGNTYPVTSSASSGRPTTCGEAHSVLLSALSGSATQSATGTAPRIRAATRSPSATPAAGRSRPAASDLGFRGRALYVAEPVE